MLGKTPPLRPSASTWHWIFRDMPSGADITEWTARERGVWLKSSPSEPQAPCCSAFSRQSLRRAYGQACEGVWETTSKLICVSG